MMKNLLFDKKYSSRKVKKEIGSPTFRREIDSVLHQRRKHNYPAARSSYKQLRQFLGRHHGDQLLRRLVTCFQLVGRTNCRFLTPHLNMKCKR